MAEQLRKKQCELLELQKKKLELELMATKKKIEEQEKQINQQASSVVAKQKLEELAASKSADVKKMADSIAMLSVQVCIDFLIDENRKCGLLSICLFYVWVKK